MSASTAGPTAVVSPLWRVGDLGEIDRIRADLDIEKSEDGLKDYFKVISADVKYGQKILNELDYFIHNVKTTGISRDSIVGVESFLGTKRSFISEEIKMCLTQNHTKRFNDEVLVGLESMRTTGRYALILLMIGAIIKILKWVLDLATTSNRPKAPDGEEYAAQVEESKKKWEIDRGNVIAELKTPALISGYIKKYTMELKDDVAERVNKGAVAMDSIIHELKGEKYTNSVAAALPASTELFGRYFDELISGDLSETSALSYLASMFHSLNLGDAVFKYKDATAAYQNLPKRYKEAGCRIPTDLAIKRFFTFSKNMDHFLRNVKETFGYYIEYVTNKSNRDIDTTAMDMATRMNDLTNQIELQLQYVDTSHPIEKTDLVDSGYRIVNDKAEQLNGYVGSTVGDSSYSYMVITHGAFFNLNFRSAMEERISLSDDVIKQEVLTFFNLGPDTIAERVETDSGATKKLITDFEDWYKFFVKWSDLEKRDGSSERQIEFEALFRRIFTERGKENFYQGNTGLFYVDTKDGTETQSFYKGISVLFNLAKRVLTAGGVYYQLIDKHNKHLFVRSRK